MLAIGNAIVANCEAADAQLRTQKKLEFSGLKAAPWITDLTPLMPLTQLEELVREMGPRWMFTWDREVRGKGSGR